MVEKFKEFHSKNLLIVDVQKSFSKFFTDKYLKELNIHCDEFESVYQIWDNHVDGKDVDDDFLYEIDPEIPINDDLYHFNNQKDLIEKRYNYNVKVDFYKKILNNEEFIKIRDMESKNKIKKGDSFKTKKNTYIIFVGNNHRWAHIGIKLVNLFLSLKGKKVEIVGGSDSECLEDIFIAAKSLGVDVNRNWRFIYSANHCAIK
jgi:hypothetical protein